MQRVLLVEDDPNWAQIERIALSGLGYHVEARENAVSAIKFLDGNTIDAIVCDLHMGGGVNNGDHLLSHIIKRNTNAHYILVSGTISPEAKTELSQRIPFVHAMSKDDFATGVLLRENLDCILNGPKPDYTGRETHIQYLVDFKNRAPPADIRVYADRIKGRLFRILNENKGVLVSIA